MSQISDFFQTLLANLQVLSLKAKTMIGLIAMLAIYLFVILLTPSPFQKPQSQVASLSSNPTTNSVLTTNSTTSSIIKFDKANPTIPLGYPQNLKKNKSNPQVPSNLLIGKKAEITYSNEEKNYDYFFLYDRILNEIKDDVASDQYDVDTVPNNKKIGSLKFAQDTSKASNVRKYYEGTNYVVPKDSIFFASPDDLSGVKEEFKPKYKRELDPKRGVTIYSKTDKDVSGSTYLHDFEKNNEFKLADQVCKWITFSSTEFFCLNNKYQLTNLSTGEVVADSVVDVTEDDDNNLYFVTLKGEVFKTNLNSIKDQKAIYKTKTGENITRITYTNQKELMLHIVYDGGSEVFQAKKLEREKAQASTGYTGVKTTDKIASEMTIELLPNGSTKDRPEYKEYIVLL